VSLWNKKDSVQQVLARGDEKDVEGRTWGCLSEKFHPTLSNPPLLRQFPHPKMDILVRF